MYKCLHVGEFPLWGPECSPYSRETPADSKSDSPAVRASKPHNLTPDYRDIGLNKHT